MISIDNWYIYVFMCVSGEDEHGIMKMRRLYFEFLLYITE